MSTDQPFAGRGPTAAVVAFAMLLPTLMAWLYFVALAGGGRGNFAQQACYAGGKVVQFALPLLFCLAVGRWPALRRPHAGGMWEGLAFGLTVAGAMVVGYHLWLHASPLLAEAPARLRQKLDEFGVAGPVAFVGLGVFISILHSFLEEYYWRWFVFGRLRQLAPLWAAVVLSSLAFMAHHVLIVMAYLPGRFWSGVVPASLAVAVGGAAWAWLYHRADSLLAPWLSHALVDAGLFVVGWDLLRRAG